MEELSLILVVVARPSIISFHFLSVRCILRVKTEVLHSFDAQDVAVTSRAEEPFKYVSVFTS